MTGQINFQNQNSKEICFTLAQEEDTIIIKMEEKFISDETLTTFIKKGRHDLNLRPSAPKAPALQFETLG